MGSITYCEMNTRTSIFYLFMAILLFGVGCKEDPCEYVNCQNGGVCLEGDCQCAKGWRGDRCEIDKCGDIVCENFGTCELGECQCPDGTWGQFCENTYQSFFLGEWDAERTCNEPSQGTETTTFTSLITEGDNVLEMNLYLGDLGWIEADILDDYQFRIPPQDRAFGLFEGDGELVDDQITASFTRVYQSRNYTYSMTLTK